MIRHVSRVCVVVALSMCAARAGAQDPADVPHVIRPGLFTRVVEWAGARLDRPAAPPDGFYPETGGMIPGAGLSVGPGYRRHLFGKQMTIDASAAVSWRRYKMMRSQIAWPRLLNDRLSLAAQVNYQDFTQINHFGIGRDTLKESQTTYRLQDVDAVGIAAVRARRWLTITGRTGVLRRVDIGPGRSALYPSATDSFGETSAPGLAVQPNYLHADLTGDIDTRDEPGYPTRGGRYLLSWATFHDQDLARYGFRRVEADASHYLPLGRTVVALRGRIGQAAAGAGQEVPFYLLPTLGGSSSLRGYADYRFRDRNVVLVSAEYRWPLMHAIDAALFYDAGTVAPVFSGLTDRWIADYGIGIRAHTASRLIARVDIAHGKEGTRASLTFTAPLSPPSRSIAPYVP
jgi:outer membrane protein assembly factor BamA